MNKPILPILVNKFMKAQLDATPAEVVVPEPMKLLMRNSFIEGIKYAFNEISDLLPDDEDPAKEAAIMGQLFEELEAHSKAQSEAHEMALKIWSARREKGSAEPGIPGDLEKV